MPAPRPLAAALLLTLMLAPAGPAPAQDSLRLPDIGSSAGELLTPARQEEYGGMMLRELRNYGYLLDDPLIDDWLQALGDRSLTAEKREALVRDLLTTHLDLEAVGRFCLGRYSRGLNDAQKQEYAKLFEDYLVKVYAQLLSQYNGETLEVRDNARACSAAWSAGIGRQAHTTSTSAAAALAGAPTEGESADGVAAIPVLGPPGACRCKAASMLACMACARTPTCGSCSMLVWPPGTSITLTAPSTRGPHPN